MPHVEHQAIVDAQLAFYRKGDAGCLFAAHAAGDPEKYGWRLSVSEVDVHSIGDFVGSAISQEEISTQSIILPSVVEWPDLKNLLATLHETPLVSLGQKEEFAGSMEVMLNLVEIR